MHEDSVDHPRLRWDLPPGLGTDLSSGWLSAKDETIDETSAWFLGMSTRVRSRKPIVVFVVGPARIRFHVRRNAYRVGNLSTTNRTRLGYVIRMLGYACIVLPNAHLELSGMLASTTRTKLHDDGGFGAIATANASAASVGCRNRNHARKC